jgi:hypothetical protein
MCKKQIWNCKMSCHLVLELCSTSAYRERARNQSKASSDNEDRDWFYCIFIQCQTLTIFVLFKEIRVENMDCFAVMILIFFLDLLW